MSHDLTWIAPDAPAGCFPDPGAALDEPNGLLAVGGDLSVTRLLHAYRSGIFPWYEDGQPILWWSPNPRAVLWPHRIRISRSLRKRVRQQCFDLRLDTAFSTVIRACAAPRTTSPGTWITQRMFQAYCSLHAAGYAHSLECWDDEGLAGGLYGVALGRVFFGESMFTRRTDASKVALVALSQLGFELIDCQLPNPHLMGLGAELMEREQFLGYLDRWCDLSGPPLPSQRLHLEP